MDDIIASLIGTTQQQYNTAMRHWFRANGAEGATPTELTALCDRWYTITRTGWDGSVTFYQPDVSAVSTGMRGGDNAGLSCVHGHFALSRAHWFILARLSPNGNRGEWAA